VLNRSDGHFDNVTMLRFVLRCSCNRTQQPQTSLASNLTAMANENLTDYYSLLRIARSASPNTIKAAYHHALLRAHPDKIRQRADDPSQLTDVGLLHDAFLTLSSATLRSAYDVQGVLSRRTDPRPAQVVSLDRFECSDLEGPDGGAVSSCWTLDCRCGGKYEVTEDHLERGSAFGCVWELLGGYLGGI
jgi:diphthamide biosynthesis protein 4